MRQKRLILNWKLNADYVSITKFFKNFSPLEKTKCFVAPSFLGLIPSLMKKENKDIEIVAQNASVHSLGNHTGSNSWIEVKDYGINWVFVNHPDVIKDNNEKVFNANLKLKKFLSNGLNSIVFIEEDRQTLDSDVSKEKLKVQINQIFEGIEPELMDEKVILVYVPKFNTSLGLKTNPKFVFDTVKILRTYLRDRFGFYIGNNLPILYGGELISDDLEEIAQNYHLDGILLEDERAVSYKYASLVNKFLYNGQNINYEQFYEKNPIIDIPTEAQRNFESSKPAEFDIYDASNEHFFKKIDLKEEEI